MSFRTLTEPGDVILFSTWMNDPRVAAVWQETGTLEAHAAYIAQLQADPATLPLLGCLDGAPFGYFELYWARESRLGPLYESGPYDRGWHVAIGDDAVRGRPYLSAWLPSLMHYLFLDEPRTQRIVGEPRADHAQQIWNLHASGFATIATVDFPHKRAALVALSRAHFVRDRLWVPGAAAADAAPRPPSVPV
ncbi:acetyltransferase [Methylobacterium tardum]|uniref:GNAT family N-acetyltransferase n=1 Tax=Methylobacterium tardum TaxID=374432 RepID=UPI002021B652|nr:GNAT family N-acetyltransferase [Methylobacterium tardum]URD38548.1 acetyltransferase [Methylobacterium tardum]